MTTPDRWHQVTEIFHGARAEAPSARVGFLSRACGQDEALRADVQALLDADEAAGAFGETGAPGVVHLPPGTMLGTYRVEALIGVGGMAEAYRATDLRLRRTVALKILAADRANGVDARARFRREAQFLAALNHPNVGAIYGVEDGPDGFSALVLEFVEGQTLAERLRSGRLKRAEALAFATQLADALSAAHDRGIVHRDLKPANIKITPAGLLKVLDFGIAKLTHVSAGHDEPASASVVPTREGAVIGTVPYMSPEQARGQAVDKRTDIWAFGCVVYEMLTGCRAFAGSTSSDTLARILEREPDWDALPGDVPASVRTLLRRCLRKDPSQRLHDIADAKLEILEMNDGTAGPAPEASRQSGTRPWRDRVVGAALAIAVVAGGVALWWLFGSRPGPPVSQPRLQLGIRFPDNHLTGAGLEISPDGRFLAGGVFDTKFEIWLHAFDSDETRVVRGTDGGYCPFWSPDGSKLGFFLPGKLLQVDPVNGKPAVIADVPAAARDGTWSSRGTVLFAAGDSVFQVPAAGGSPAPLALEGKWVSVSSPRFLPDLRHFIFFAHQAGRGEVRVGSLDSPKTAVLVASNAPASFVPPDRLLFVQGTTVQAQTLDQRTFTLVGQPIQVAEDVLPVTGGLFTAQFAASADKLAFVTATAGSLGRLTWFDRDGVPGGSIPQAENAEYLNPAISPDGTRVAVNRMDPATGNWDVWVLNGDGGQVKVTSDPARDMDPVWSPNGKEIVFASDRAGHAALYKKAVDTSSPETLVKDFDAATTSIIPSNWSADGRYILYSLLVSGTPRSVWAMPMSGGSPFQLTDGRYMSYDARVSPNGRWVAYCSFDTGQPEVYVQEFPVPGRRIKISQGGAVHPRWTAGGGELVYWALPSSLMARTITSAGEDVRLGAPRLLRQAF